MKKGLNIILIGPPGAGKSTQAHAITERYGLPHLSTGDMVRSAISKGGVLAGKLKPYVDQGKIAPEGLIADMIESRISAPDCQNGFILDGFPRTLKQAKILNRILEKQNSCLDTVIEIGVNDDNVMRRICGRFSCGECDAGYHKEYKQPVTADECDDCGAEGAFVKRSDDRPEVVKNRLTLYKNETGKLLPFYDRAGLLNTVDGNAPPQQIKDQIFKILDKKQSLKRQPVKGGAPRKRR